MTLDHFALYFNGHIPHWVWFIFRALGRLGISMFAYMLILGYRRTRSLTIYFIRIAVFALITQGAMTLTANTTTSFTFNNVLYTLAAGLILIWAMIFNKINFEILWHDYDLQKSSQGGEQPDYGVRINIKGFPCQHNTGLILGIILCILSVVLVWLMKPDYS